MMGGIMAKPFSELSEDVKAGWDEETRRIYDAAASGFVNEVKEQADLGAAIRTAREVRGCSQVALAEMTGLQQAEISRIERGTGNPTTSTLLRLARALDLRLYMAPDQN